MFENGGVEKGSISTSWYRW